MSLAPPISAARVVDRRVFGGPGDWVPFVAFAALNLAAVAWAAGRALSQPALWRDPVTWVLVVPAAGALLSFEARWFSLPLMRAPEPMAPVPGQRIAVVTTFVPSLEPLTMLRRTVRALVAMDVEHDTWVLDEADDPKVRRLCEELGARHFSRLGEARYQQATGVFQARSKHGNYNAWLDAVGYDLYDVVVGFDPDHVPKPAFLERTLGYLADERVGYVQAPQHYYNQPASLVARGAAEETYAYYSSVQMTSYALGYPIVTGCHNVHRTSALREVGGFAAHDADDLLITVLYRAAGWEGVYVPELLASGITPVDWRGYLTQQRRWARSVLDVKLRLFPKVAGDLPVTERVVAGLHGLYYLHGLATALGVAALALSLATGWHPAMAGSAIATGSAPLYGALLACELYRQRFYLDPPRERGLHLRAGVLKFAKWPFVLLALGDALSSRRQPYAVTAKVRVAGGPALLRAHGPGVVAVGAGAAVGAATGHAAAAPVLLVAAAYVLLTLAVIASDTLPAPAPYDDALAAALVPWSEPG